MPEFSVKEVILFFNAFLLLLGSKENAGAMPSPELTSLDGLRETKILEQFEQIIYSEKRRFDVKIQYLLNPERNLDELLSEELSLTLPNQYANDSDEDLESLIESLVGGEVQRSEVENKLGKMVDDFREEMAKVFLLEQPVDLSEGLLVEIATKLVVKNYSDCLSVLIFNVYEKIKSEDNGCYEENLTWEDVFMNEFADLRMQSSFFLQRYFLLKEYLTRRTD